MPTYGYRCTTCGNEFDVWQRMSDEAGAACPVCGAAGKRLIFPAGIVFKGQGFYKTDSRGSSPSSSSAGAAASASTSTSNGPAPTTPSKEAPTSSSPTTPAASPSPGGGA